MIICWIYSRTDHWGIRTKPEAFFDNPNEPMERREKWLAKFHEITRELSGMMKVYGEITGREMTETEFWRGLEK